MNLKYYLRGLGIGIIVTALIMGIATSGKRETLSDSEIMERAKALGMTEETTLIVDAAAEPSATDGEEEKESEGAAEQQALATPDKEPEPTEAPQPTDIEAETAASADVVTPEATPSPQPTEAPTPAATPEPEKTDSQSPDVITIQINSGDGSYSACTQLEAAGLVESAAAFDRYLYDNGYDKRINVGVFEIPKDAEPEQIAKILARLE